MYYYGRRMTLEDVDVQFIMLKLEGKIFRSYKEILSHMHSCKKEETILEKYRQLNKMDDEAVLLIAYAKSIATKPVEHRRIARAEAQYNALMCKRRDAVIIGE